MRRIYLYGFSKELKIVDSKYLQDWDITINNIKRVADYIINSHDDAIVVYAIDNTFGLYQDYFDTIKTKDFTKNVEFMDTVRRGGILVAKK